MSHERSKRLGLDLTDHLERNDSGTLLARLDDRLVTGTNVGDAAVAAWLSDR